MVRVCGKKVLFAQVPSAPAIKSSVAETVVHKSVKQTGSEIDSAHTVPSGASTRNSGARVWIESHTGEPSFAAYIDWCFRDDVLQTPVSEAFFSSVLKEVIRGRDLLTRQHPEIIRRISSRGRNLVAKARPSPTATPSRTPSRPRTTNTKVKYDLMKVADDDGVCAEHEPQIYTAPAAKRAFFSRPPGFSTSAELPTLVPALVPADPKYRRLLIDSIYHNLESDCPNLSSDQMFVVAANMEHHLLITADSLFGYMDTCTLHNRLMEAMAAVKRTQDSSGTYAAIAESLTPFKVAKRKGAPPQGTFFSYSMQSSEPHSSQLSFKFEEDNDSDYKDNDSDYEESSK